MNHELDKNEILSALNELYRINPTGEQPTVEAVEQFLKDVDEDGTGTVNFTEFKKAFNHIMSMNAKK
jgi:Ca2+-binding EF-hand superfamily protein